LGIDGKDVVHVARLPESKLEEWKKKVMDRLKIPKPDNVFYLRYALQMGVTIDELYKVTKIDPWFLHNIKQIVDVEEELSSYSL
jgi:carbamoyl-phosphate synthase large subunit